MNINRAVLKPLKSPNEDKKFFSKRIKRKNRKKAKKWLKKLDKAHSSLSLRKTISRISKRNMSVPYSISQVGFWYKFLS